MHHFFGSRWNKRIDKADEFQKQFSGNTRTHLWNNRKRNRLKMQKWGILELTISIFSWQRIVIFSILFVRDECLNIYFLRNYNFGRFKITKSKIGYLSILKFSSINEFLSIRLFHSCYKFAISILRIHSVCQFG